MGVLSFNVKPGWRFQQDYRNSPFVYGFWVTGPESFYQPQYPLWRSYVVLPR